MTVLKIKVKTKSGKQEIVKFGDNNYLIYLESEPENNKANIELLNLLSKYFGTPAARIKIISGLSSNMKLVEIN